MKKILNILLILMLMFNISSCKKEDSLPIPELEDGLRGQLGIDKNINEKTIDNYLNRQDSVYRDMRMLKDEANYEAIGGDSYLSGIVEGFEVVSYPYICNVEGLPQEVGNTYSGVTLFTHRDNEYIANYEESMHILESLFPKDKYIFLMCGGGGYAGMMRSMLIELGWDENKIYNTGGYWYYDGNHKIETVYEEDGVKHYDFSNIIIHNIEFSALNKIHDSGSEDDGGSEDIVVEDGMINISSTAELNELINNKETFALYVYLPGCSSCASFHPYVKQFMELNEIEMYSVNLREIFNDKNVVTERIYSSPSIFIFEGGNLISYLDPASNDDLEYYSSLEGLNKWFIKNIDINKLKKDCDSCSLS